MYMILWMFEAYVILHMAQNVEKIIKFRSEMFDNTKYTQIKLKSAILNMCITI